MRHFLVASLILTILGGCVKINTPRECRDITAKDRLTYRYCETAGTVSVERLSGAGAATDWPRGLLDDPKALEIIRRDAFGERSPAK